MKITSFPSPDKPILLVLSHTVMDGLTQTEVERTILNSSICLEQKRSLVVRTINLPSSSKSAISIIEVPRNDVTDLEYEAAARAAFDYIVLVIQTLFRKR